MLEANIMDFKLTTEQEMIRKMVREFAVKEVEPLAAELDEEERFPEETIEKMGKLNILANIKRLYNGSITKHSKVETYMAKSVLVDGPTRLQIETDGETLGHGPMNFQIIPRSVKVISGELSA